MRTGALALLLLMASCGRGDPPNRAEAVPGVGGPEAGTRTASVPSITIAAPGPGGCEARWDGQPVTPAQITERGGLMLRQAVEAIGGAQNIGDDNLPVPNVEAPADLSFACADTILFAIQRAGMFSVKIRPTGGQAPVPLDFPLDTNAPPPPVPTVLGLGAGGRMTWNGDPIDAAGLTAQLGRIGSTTPSAGGEPEAPRAASSCASRARRRSVSSTICCGRPAAIISGRLSTCPRRAPGRRRRRLRHLPCRQCRQCRSHSADRKGASSQTRRVDPYRPRGYRPPRPRAGGG